MKMAIETSAREHVWADISNEKSLARDREVSAILERKPDVCVLIRVVLLLFCVCTVVVLCRHSFP